MQVFEIKLMGLNHHKLSHKSNAYGIDVELIEILIEWSHKLYKDKNYKE
jgi:hypothetical protein